MGDSEGVKKGDHVELRRRVKGRGARIGEHMGVDKD